MKQKSFLFSVKFVFVNLIEITGKQTDGNQNEDEISQPNLPSQPSCSNDKSEYFCLILFLEGFYKEV